jgi:hypothetical protein
MGDIVVDIVQKDIKNIHLSVYPPTGRVRISAPNYMSLDNIRAFAVSKIGWIKKQQNKFSEQEREAPREYIDRESHYVWGERYLLEIVERSGPQSVKKDHRRLVLSIRPGASIERRQKYVDEWYRGEIKGVLPPLISKWEGRLNVEIGKCFVQKMKTKWGSCNTGSGNIRLNLELAKKPIECLEYVLLHEMVHLLEPNHNQRFQEFMNRFMPQWRHYRDALNRSPLRHEEWDY